MHKIYHYLTIKLQRFRENWLRLRSACWVGVYVLIWFRLVNIGWSADMMPVGLYLSSFSVNSSMRASLRSSKCSRRLTLAFSTSISSACCKFTWTCCSYSRRIWEKAGGLPLMPKGVFIDMEWRGDVLWARCVLFVSNSVSFSSIL